MGPFNKCLRLAPSGPASRGYECLLIGGSRLNADMPLLLSLTRRRHSTGYRRPEKDAHLYEIVRSLKPQSNTSDIEVAEFPRQPGSKTEISPADVGIGEQLLPASR